ncbi:hypothetical protein HYC85_012772 [Camellia sinensis]|uniref:hAT-like transposase RNase-H fold domain-containing protein n=1 Tax=Camellia sinensis TaxID=4442 RepID=A0A7J7HDF9_CAMSI|nr:hypothetical protein HYC85_012772 [Camellia sinensis]
MATDAAIGKSLSEWGIESKVFTITMGNKFDDICEIIKDHIQGKNDICEILNGRPFCVYCCADMLSRMVQDGFEEISDAIFDIRLIVPGGRYLPIWYLILDRLQEGLPLESLGEFYSSDDYDGFDIPSPNEWKKVQGVCKLVQIIYNVAQILFDTKHYSTAPLYLHSLQELRSNLGEECRNSDVFVSNLAWKMLSKLEECRKNMFMVLSIATVMDSRCKMKFIEFSVKV